MKKNLLITGGAGFVGSNLALFLKKKLRNYHIICLDNLIRTGSSLNVSRLKDAGITFVKGDIRNKKKLLSLPKIHLLNECSAEPSVLAAYENPNYTIETNLIGTINCLELARRDGAQFLFLSTSRVYPIDRINDIPYKELPTRFDWRRDIRATGYSYQGITLDFPLLGRRSLYGATKLSSEHIMTEFLDMYSLKGIINRFGVISGPWQMGKIDQGIVGYWVMKHKFNSQLSYIGYGGQGKQVRDVVHVDDVCKLILHQIDHFKKYQGEIFNAGGGRKNSFSLKELTTLTQHITNKKIPIESVKKQRKADIRIYIADNSQITKKTGWEPERSIEDIAVDVNRWVEKYSVVLQKVLD